MPIEIKDKVECQNMAWQKKNFKVQHGWHMWHMVDMKKFQNYLCWSTLKKNIFLKKNKNKVDMG